MDIRGAICAARVTHFVTRTRRASTKVGLKVFKKPRS